LDGYLLDRHLLDDPHQDGRDMADRLRVSRLRLRAADGLSKADHLLAARGSGDPRLAARLLV